MNLVWKLLRQHISIAQFAGFFFANLAGMLIVLLGYQFYRDVLPVFTQQDSFMSSDFVIMNKKIGSTLSSSSHAFSKAEQEEILSQPFCRKAGAFTTTEYHVDASMGVSGQKILSSELFFESVPDGFIDVPLTDWKYTPGDKVVPVIIPRTYINMYNFGFAQSRSLPKISEGLAGMIDLSISVRGNGHNDVFRGKVIGFSGRLNSILVPQTFMDWSNEYYAPGQKSDPTRLLIEAGNPADNAMMQFADDKGYEIENDKLNAEKTTYFLRLVISLVMAIGLVISVLSFYILMLSIYLLVQKNSSKLENLLLIGYSPSQVARPYQLLTIALNIGVLVIALVILWFIREYYMDVIAALYPSIEEGSMMPALLLGVVLLLFVSIVNLFAIRNKIVKIWKHKE